jgi:UDP-N-acetylmuramoyl-tripeptide--D-alanyl-D-alanine ligase
VIPLTAGWIADAVDGRLDHLDRADVLSSVSIDSRDQGDLFVAIAGERQDGHDFAADAVARGAVAVLAGRPVVDPEGQPLPAILVDDPVAALGRLAHRVRRELLSARVIGLTGSSGKTSTKDLLGQVLDGIGPTVRPMGSFNTEVGLPLTILSADPATRFLVLEMGMRGLGHIAYLARIAEPDIGIVLNVGSAHLGVVGTREAIASAKGELAESLTAGGVAILNRDDPFVAAMAGRTAAEVVFFGETADSDVVAREVTIDRQARASFVLHSRLPGAGGEAPVRLQVSGAHFVSNALAAAATGLVCGGSVADVAAALSSARIDSRWRMQVVERADGVIVVNDAYNANPESMRAALKALAAMGEGRRTWAVLGEMRELGDRSIEEHDAIGRLAVRLDISRLVCVGEATRALHLGACTEGSWGEESVLVPDADAALALLRREVAPGDVVLVKASRSVGLERVAEGLLAGQP